MAEALRRPARGRARAHPLSSSSRPTSISARRKPRKSSILASRHYPRRNRGTGDAATVCPSTRPALSGGYPRPCPASALARLRDSRLLLRVGRGRRRNNRRAVHKLQTLHSPRTRLSLGRTAAESILIPRVRFRPPVPRTLVRSPFLLAFMRATALIRLAAASFAGSLPSLPAPPRLCRTLFCWRQP